MYMYRYELTFGLEYSKKVTVVVTYSTTCTEEVAGLWSFQTCYLWLVLDPGSGMNLLDITSKDWGQKALDVRG